MTLAPPAHDAEDLAVTQRVVSAAGAPPVATSAPSSVFALGSTVAPDATPAEPAAERPAAPPKPKKAAKAAQEPTSGFKGWLRRQGEESAEGRPKRKPKASKTAVADEEIEMAKAERQLAALEAEVAALRQRRPLDLAVPQGIVVERPSEAPAAADAADDPVFRIGSDGSIDIECDGNAIRLSAAKGRARKLVDWVFRIDELIRPPAEKGSR